MQQGFQPLHIKDELICGLYDETLQTDIIAKASHLIKLEDVIKHAEAYESAQRDQSTLHKSNESTIARTSIYQQCKHQQLSNNPKLSEKNKSTRPYPGCGSQTHGQQGFNDRHLKYPAWGKTCNNCKIPNHLVSVCHQKSSESASALIALLIIKACQTHTQHHKSITPMKYQQQSIQINQPTKI